MDKQTAIDLLDNLLGMVEDNHDSDYDTAIHMGIDALKSNASNALSVLDCVERQAVIDAAIEAVDEWDGGYNLSRADMIEKAINNLPSAQPRWVSMEEAFPDDEGKYMVTWITPKFPNKRFIGIAEYEITRWSAENSRWEGEWLFDDYMNAYVDVTVTAWMPLPEPWRGGQDETN